MNLEDLMALQEKELQLVLLELSRDEFALAVKGLEETFRDKWYHCISRRAREMILDDHCRMGEVSPGEVARAVAHVLEVATRLTTDGRIKNVVTSRQT